jgi:TetR/AcrR family transcriptional regulator, mexJK operon transcriptional repressor
MVDSDEQAETRSQRKRRQVLEAATAHFLADGYERTSMDNIARTAAVSKQTVYQHFETKAALMAHVVTSVIEAAGVDADAPIADLAETGDLSRDLRVYARAQLRAVIQPVPMQLRRLIVAEAQTFPQLARLFYELGPQSAVNQLAVVLARLHQRGILAAPDAERAAADLNWLVLSDAINRAMFLGTDQPLPEHHIRAHADHACETFLSAYLPADTNRPSRQ